MTQPPDRHITAPSEGATPPLVSQRVPYRDITAPFEQVTAPLVNTAVGAVHYWEARDGAIKITMLATADLIDDRERLKRIVEDIEIQRDRDHPLPAWQIERGVSVPLDPSSHVFKPVKRHCIVEAFSYTPGLD